MVPDRGHYDTLKWIVAQKTDLSKGTDTREHNRQQNEKELAHQHAGKFPSLSFSTKKPPVHCQWQELVEEEAAGY